MFNQIPSRFADALRTFFDLGEDPGVQTVAPELFGTVDLLDELELFIQQFGGALGSGQLNRIADAANFSEVQLFNPNASNMLGILYRARVNGANPLDVFSQTAAAAVNTVSAFHRDLRRDTPGQRPVLQTRSGIAATRVNNFLWGTINQNEEHRGIYIIPPGRGISYYPAAINLAPSVFVQWLELPAPPEMLRIL